jgi:hypothetical protein
MRGHLQARIEAASKAERPNRLKQAVLEAVADAASLKMLNREYLSATETAPGCGVTLRNLHHFKDAASFRV